MRYPWVLVGRRISLAERSDMGGLVVDSRRIGRRRVELEEFTLVRGGSASCRGTRRHGTGSLQTADVAFELGPGKAAAAADVDRVQLAGLHQRVDRRAAQAQDLRGLFGVSKS